MIRVENLSKSFGRKEALHGVNLELDTEVYGLLGANGAGKTTLIRCMTGLYQPRQGTVFYDEEPIQKSRRYRQTLGYLPQAFGMFRELTLYEMMDYICTLKGIAKGSRDSEIMEALRKVNLEDKAGDRINTLSGGMVRRAGIAQAIMGKTKVLLLDEPTAGLDPSERARFKNTVSGIKKDRMVLISTHIVEDVDACCRFVIVINEGHVVFNGSCEELKAIAAGKVFQVPEDEYQSITAKTFILKTSETEGRVYYRILAKEMQTGQSEKPSLEDGYMCLVKGFA